METKRPLLNSAAWWAGNEMNIAAFTFETSRLLDLNKRINQHAVFCQHLSS